jgi:hypothetical protein
MVPEKYASIKTPADLDNLPTSVIVSIYNAYTGKSIKGFHTRSKGIEQTWKSIDEHRRANPKSTTEAPAPKSTTEAPAPKSTTEAPAPKSLPKGTRQSKNSPDHIIEVLVDENPKSRPNGLAYKQTAVLLQFHGRPASDFLAEEGKQPELDHRKGWARSELAYAVRVQHVRLVESQERK